MSAGARPTSQSLYGHCTSNLFKSQVLSTCTEHRDVDFVMQSSRVDWRECRWPPGIRISIAEKND